VSECSDIELNDSDTLYDWASFADASRLNRTRADDCRHPALFAETSRDLCPWCCEDGTGTLASAARINSDECVQYYDFSAGPGGVLESEGLRRGSGKSRAGESWESPRLKRAAQSSEPAPAKR
jgi:hypothetical protein